MNCKKLQHKIEELHLEKGMKLELDEQRHVNDCTECRIYYKRASAAHQLLKEIQQWEPVLDNPHELTESIMLSISQEEQNSLNDHHSRFKILVRFLTAAVVTLLITLGVEQYIVLNKVQLLELKMGKVQHAHPTKYLIIRAGMIDIEQIFKVGENGNTLKGISRWYQLEQFKNADFTFNDLKRYTNKEGSLKSAISKSTQ